MKKNPSFKKFISLLKGEDYNATSLASIVRKSKPTLLKRFRDPCDFTLGDIVQILRDGKIELDDLLEALRRDLK